ncbi:DUF6470 family protein [Cytobacillus sp. FJAT-54145]|uniref:DUF6470 family protein n=1 Tax=Cytobacillus spartinae TaxID=3299023 RepID=A0ABW6KDM3_9BACI
MQVPQIRIQTTPAKIGIHTQDAVLNIEQRPADMRIQQPTPELNIKNTPAKLTIDQSKAFDEMGLKHVFQLIKEFSQKGKQDWMNGVARIVQQGNELMKIENNGNPLGEQAKRNSERKTHEFNVGWIPSPFSVKNHYSPGRLQMDWQTHNAVIDIKPNKPTIQYAPGKVDFQLIQRNSIQIDFTL